jgi:hypothetical protein
MSTFNPHSLARFFQIACLQELCYQNFLIPTTEPLLTLNISVALTALQAPYELLFVIFEFGLSAFQSSLHLILLSMS